MQRKCRIMTRTLFISKAYRSYMKDAFFVNRHYQRKLVWELKEKLYFIDSIMNEMPVPLFFIVGDEALVEGVEYVPSGKNDERFPEMEILDGLQRLDAIFSFINGDYGIKKNGKIYYFDLNALRMSSITNSIKQKYPKLDFELCENFAQYELPVTFISADQEKVEEIFKRINSTGRRLSEQDLRHAGVNSKFSYLVHDTATRVRGDYSDDSIINLRELHELSITSRNLKYGISVDDVFWVKNDIILEKNLRTSKDEEIIANIYNIVISGYTAGMGKTTLDSLYDTGSSIFRRNEDYLQYNDADLIQRFCDVYSDLNTILEYSGKRFSDLVLQGDNYYNKDLVFIIIFLAMMQLHDDHFVIKDFGKIVTAFDGIADKELGELISKSNSIWNREVRSRLITRVKNVIKPFTEYEDYNEERNEEVLDLLKHAIVEEQMYDFKSGITDLKLGTINPTVISKCVKTLVAMANARPGERGIIAIGVLDKESDAAKYEVLYGEQPFRYNNYYVPGVKLEADKFYGGMQKYIDKIKSLIENEKEHVGGDVICEIMTTISLIGCDERPVIVLSLQSNKMLFFESKLFVRYQSDNKEIKMGSDEFYAIMDKFGSLK